MPVLQSALGEDSCSRGDDGASMDGIPVHKPPSPVLAFSEDANITMVRGISISVAYRYRKSISIIELVVSIISICIGFLATNF